MTKHLPTRRDAFGIAAGLALTGQASAAASVPSPTDIDPSAAKLSDATDVFRNAIDAAVASRAGVVSVPPGKYSLRTLQIRNNVRIIGSGRGVTKLIALPSSEPAFITLDKGSVQYSGLESLTLIGGTPLAATTANQAALELVASPGSNGKLGCGLWWSTFRELEIQHFERGVVLVGGADNYVMPHQFLSFRDMVVYLPRAARGPAIRLVGQVNQVVFEQIHLDTRAARASVLFEILQSPSHASRPELILLNIVTMQDAELGLRVDGAQNVTVSNCWFEGVNKAIEVSAATVDIQITGCRFANAGSPVISMPSAASGSIRSNVFAGPRSKGVAVSDTARGDLATTNTFIWSAQP